MTLRYFEGPAGTGKTHNVVAEALALVNGGILGDYNRVLALTFMNGARRRLQSRLSRHAPFRRRYECQTFDVFARTLAARRNSLVRSRPEIAERAADLNEFDGPCSIAGSLLETEQIADWVAASFPVVLVDEAQDLDEHRLRILQGIAGPCHVLAAADEFQCLTAGRDTGAVIGWLEGAGETTRLVQPMRTTLPGLLAAAGAVRDRRDIRAVLAQSQRARGPTWNGRGFRLLETHAANAGLVAWTIANEISLRPGPTAILTPDSQSRLIRDAIDKLSERRWNRQGGQAFGPYPCVWEAGDRQIAASLLEEIAFPNRANFDEARAALQPSAGNAAIASVLRRLDRRRRVHGQTEFVRADIAEMVNAAVRDQSRLGLRAGSQHTAMTIQRAKNREFQNVVVLWPHTAAGEPEQLRRLLYNAITRAINHCSVIVLGRGRLGGPPFSPQQEP